jgi:hypothetical protein
MGKNTFFQILKTLILLPKNYFEKSNLSKITKILDTKKIQKSFEKYIKNALERNIIIISM